MYMKHDALQGAEKYTKAHQRKKRWYRIVSGLACIVVFCTVYALILPAITMEKGVCEIPEHTHSEACYTTVTSMVAQTVPVCTVESLILHQHTNACYDGEGNLTCGYADFVVHRHDSACYDENGNLWCALPEIAVHKHTESCYAVTEAVAEAHTHSDGCYIVERGELICTESTETGHEHMDECYEQIRTLICDLSAGSVDETETVEPELICGKREVILHKHTSDCYDDAGNLICGKTQVLEHQHTDACFETKDEAVDVLTLTCELEEHTHTESCYAQSDEEDEAIVALLDEDKNSTTRTDLSSFIGLDTNFTSAQYNPNTDEVEVSFHMTFSMTKADIQSAKYQFTYVLPEGIIIPDAMLGKTYDGRDTSGAKGFTYQFVKNDDGTYSVLIDFDKTYVDKHDNFSGYINFSAYAGEDAWMEGGGYEFKFNDSCTVQVPVSKIEQEEDESIHYQIAVSKSNSGYDAATNKITYTITVDTTKGTPNPLNLTDILTAQGLEMDKVEIGSVRLLRPVGKHRFEHSKGHYRRRLGGELSIHLRQ